MTRLDVGDFPPFRLTTDKDARRKRAESAFWFPERDCCPHRSASLTRHGAAQVARHRQAAAAWHGTAPVHTVRGMKCRKRIKDPEPFGR